MSTVSGEPNIIGPSSHAVALAVEGRFKSVCIDLFVSPKTINRSWEVIATRYNEPHRAYHTLDHINTMLAMAYKHRNELIDPNAVDLAIIYHDIVYDSGSKTNEEDSATLFLSTMSTELDKKLCDKICSYIIETKKHEVTTTQDTDLQMFIDFDMAILGTERHLYEEYARQIRQEYEFVPEKEYCKARANFLTTYLEQNQHGEWKAIYATKLFKEALEKTARGNIAWECEQLMQGNLV